MRGRSLALLTLVGLSGCLEPVVYRLGGDSGVATGAPTPTAGNPATEPCPLPDHVSLTRAVGLTGLTHAYVADPASWTLSMAHADAMLTGAGPAGSGWRSTDLWALGLEATALGCNSWTEDSEHAVSYPSDPLTVGDGCFAIAENGPWTDFCRLWPASCAGDHAELVGAGTDGHFPRGVEVLAAQAVFLTAMLQTHGAADPVGWLDGASDPAVRAKVLAIAWFDSPFSDHLTAVVAGCADQPVESCVTESFLAERVERVGSHAAELAAAREAGDCVSGSLTEADVGAWVRDVASLHASEDGPGLTAAGLTVLDDGGALAAQAGPVARAVEGARLTPLACPGDLLQTWYGIGCP